MLEREEETKGFRMME